MVNYTPTLNALVLPSLKTQIASGVSIPTVEVDCLPDLVGQYTKQQVDDSNQKLVDMIKKLPEFIEKEYFSRLSSNHPFLVRYAGDHPEWAAVNVMLVDHPDLKMQVLGRDGKVGQKWKKINVYKFTGLIYHFERHYLGVDNGLQQMINDLCINSTDGTTLNGREAHLQEMTWSHLHNSDTIFDANPLNGIFETFAKNQHRWMCQRELWSTCGCRISCLQGEIMSFVSWFEKIVEKEMASVNGYHPSYTESDVRRSFLSRIRNWFAANHDDYTLPDYVDDLESMVPKYQALEGMRPRIDVKSPHSDLQGYLPHGQTDTVKAEEMILGLKPVPSELLEQLKEAVRPLRPVKTNVVEEDNGGDDASTVAAVVAAPDPFNGVEPPTELSFDQARVDKENYWRFCCVSAVPCVLMNASLGNFVTASNHTHAANDPVPTDVEVHVESIFCKGILLNNNAQTMHFDYKKMEWGSGSIVNDYLRTGHADESLHIYSKKGIYKPTLPKLMMIVATIINGWDTVWGRDLQKALHHLSIVGPIPSSDGRADGSGGEEEEEDEGGEGEGEGNAVPAAESVGVISGVLACAQHYEASHQDHPTTSPLLESARCARTSRIVNEHYNLNKIRRLCSDMPTVVCLGLCQHTPRCNPLHIKLTEELLKLCVSVALNTEVRPGGDFVDGNHASITRHFLDLFKRSFGPETAPACPEWINDLESTYSLGIEDGEAEEEEGNLYDLWTCEFCQERFQRKELCIAHESTCESRPDGMFPEAPVEAPPPARRTPPSDASDFSNVDYINFIKSGIKFGLRNTSQYGFFSQSIKPDMMARDPTFDCTKHALKKLWLQGKGSKQFQDFLNGHQTDRNVTDEGTGLVTGKTRGSVTLVQLRACTGSNNGCVCICHRRYIDPAVTLPPAPAPEVE